MSPSSSNGFEFVRPSMYETVKILSATIDLLYRIDTKNMKKVNAIKDNLLAVIMMISGDEALYLNFARNLEPSDSKSIENESKNKPTVGFIST